MLPVSALANAYYVTHSGAGLHDGSSLINAWSVSDFNASTFPGPGDTVYFYGTITSTVAPRTSGAGDGPQRLTLNFANAELNSANPRIYIDGEDYLDIQGGTFGTASNGNLITTNDGAINVGITVSNWTHTGAVDSSATFFRAKRVSFALVEDNHVENAAGLIFGDTTYTHDIVVRNNYATTAPEGPAQSDPVKFGDAYNIIIEGNYLLQRTPDPTHNDAIQFYRSGATPNGQPHDVTVRYNWIEMDVPYGDNNNSWMMTEDWGGPVYVYGNVFVGRGIAGSNGTVFMRSSNYTVYYYNNTLIHFDSPIYFMVRPIDSGTFCMKNNIFYSTDFATRDLFHIEMEEGCGGWDHNFAYNLADCDSNITGVNGSCTIDPGFTGFSDDDFSLGPQSPLIGRGESLVDDYAIGLAPGTSWPGPALITRSDWSPGAYAVNTPDTTPPVISITTPLP